MLTKCIKSIEGTKIANQKTAENATLNPNETKDSENGNNANTQAAASAQYRPQPRHPTRQRKALQRLGFNT